jgi:ATP-binding cassette subfamily B protein
MASNAIDRNIFAQPITRILRVLKMERHEISSVYFYAILQGLIQLSLPLGIQSIISFVLGGTISASLIFLIVLVVGGVFITGLLQVNQLKLIEKVQQKIFVRYSFVIADRLPRINLQKLDGGYLPEMVNRFFDTISLQKGISKLLLDIPAATIQILFGLILLSFYHPVFILFGLSLITIIFLILKTTSAKGMESSLRESDYKYKVAGWLEEIARVIKSFKFSRTQELSLAKTDKNVSGYLNQRTIHFKILLKQYWTLIVFKVIITASMLIVGSVLLVNQQLNIGQFIAAEIVILMVITSVEKLIINLDNVYDVLTAVEKLGKISDVPLEENGIVKLAENTGAISIEINNLDFRYADDQLHPVLNNISLKFAAGEKICIMGRAGSGKSTLLKLLTGAYKRFDGSININNMPINNYDLSTLRDNIGILFSQHDIFEGTLLENISMGNEKISPEHILELAGKLGLKKFLSTLPEGFGTMLDPAGKKLSRKIIQKILLLRALVNHPGLILLEEPFEGLEEEPKASIINYLLNDCKDQTMLISSNDAAFAASCDKVLFLEEGRVKAFDKWDAVKSKIRN